MKDKPFKITVQYYDNIISFEKESSDVSFDEFMDMVKKITSSIYSPELWDNYWEDKL